MKSIFSILISLIIFASSCRGPNVQTPATIAATPVESSSEPTSYTYEIVNTFPHDPQAFTQGLVFADGIFYESTGLNGESSLRKVEVTTGKVIKKIEVPNRYFAEGLALFQGQLFQLTWQDQKGFIYDHNTFAPQGEFQYTGEGWGLTHDGKSLILSDGTDQIRFLDPANFKEQRSITVKVPTDTIKEINELEYVKGEIFANVWQQEFILRIDPANGKVKGMIDMRGLLKPEDKHGETDVLNGIAYDAEKDRLFITGKKWPKLFEIKLKKK
jgi:glutaminyl-peptide cyclotransferase